jgi:hypothetical protein
LAMQSIASFISIVQSFLMCITSVNFLFVFTVFSPLKFVSFHWVNDTNIYLLHLSDKFIDYLLFGLCAYRYNDIFLYLLHQSTKSAISTYGAIRSKFLFHLFRYLFKYGIFCSDIANESVMTQNKNY